MRSIVEVGPSVPAFLGKLWKLVNDTETDHLISWSPGGKTFIIKNQAEFARVLLPQYYKHNNMASFIRQLNMYGFHKITSVETGGLRYEKDEIEFSHPCFMKGHAYLLEHIKRKIANPKSFVIGDGGDKLLVKPELMSKVLADVKHMKGKQESMDSKFSVMKQENEALWREVAILRQKHIKQQQIVNNLIQFLMSLVQPSRNSNMGSHGVKRRYQLMINDAAHNSRFDQSHPKNPKLEQDLLDDLNEETACEGPTIHELAHDDVLHCEEAPSPLDPSEYITIEIPQVSPVPGSSATPTDYQVTMEDGEESHNVDPLLIRFQAPERQKKPATSVAVSSPPDVSTVSPPLRTDANYTIIPDMRLPADIFASEDSFGDSAAKENTLGSKDVLLQSSNELPAYIFTQQPINIKQEQNADLSKWKKPAPAINLANIKTELQDVDFNDMTLATVNNNGNVGRTQTMNIGDIINNNEDRTSKYASSKNKTEVDDHLDTMQSDLDSLRELLRSDSYTFDANTLLGLFGNEDPMYGLNFSNVDERTKGNGNAADTNQLMSYTGNVPDFEDFSLTEEEVPQEDVLDALDQSSVLNTPQVSLQSPFNNRPTD